MCLTLDSDLKHPEAGGIARPLVFEPTIDWERFAEPNITHAY
jgi:hypothetical protein